MQKYNLFYYNLNKQTQMNPNILFFFESKTFPASSTNVTVIDFEEEPPLDSAAQPMTKNKKTPLKISMSHFSKCFLINTPIL